MVGEKGSTWPLRVLRSSCPFLRNLNSPQSLNHSWSEPFRTSMCPKLEGTVNSRSRTWWRSWVLTTLGLLPPYTVLRPLAGATRAAPEGSPALHHTSNKPWHVPVHGGGQERPSELLRMAVAAQELGSGIELTEPQSASPFCEVRGKCFSSEVLRLSETPEIREETGGITRQLQETEL